MNSKSTKNELTEERVLAELEKSDVWSLGRPPLEEMVETIMNFKDQFGIVAVHVDEEMALSLVISKPSMHAGIILGAWTPMVTCGYEAKGSATVTLDWFD
jgi:hypothetical protein